MLHSRSRASLSVHAFASLLGCCGGKEREGKGRKGGVSGQSYLAYFACLLPIMENLFETPAKELLKCAASSPVNVSGGQQAPDTTPPSTEMRTPPVLMEKDIEQFSNMMRPTIKDEGKKGNHPDPVKLPLLQQKKKPWEYPGRYMSPTDRIMSPISQTLLARNRKAVLPPSLIFSPPPKVLDGTCKDFGPSAP